MNLTSGMDFTGSGNRQQLSVVLCVSECVFLRGRSPVLIKILIGPLMPGG